MKKLLLILLCLPLLFSCGGKNQENDLSRDNLKGKVKEIIEVRLDVLFVSGVIYNETTKYKYDENGKKIEMAYYLDEELIKKVKYKADENGSVGKVVEGKENLPFLNMSSPREFKYDEDGNNTESSYYDSDDKLIKREHKYDVDGNVTESNNYVNGELFVDNVFSTKYKYKFDESKNWIMVTIVDYFDKDSSSRSISRKIEYYE
jgi:hypothetical protein